jgi:hypothetical protein
VSESKREAVVKLYVADRKEAEEVAARAQREGLTAEVARPLIGRGWSAAITGDPDAVLAFGESVRLERGL